MIGIWITLDLGSCCSDALCWAVTHFALRIAPLDLYKLTKINLIPKGIFNGI